MVRPQDFKLAMQQACDMLVQNATRVTELLNSWDLDHNGLISKKEFRIGCQMMGLLFPKEVLEALFEHFDNDDSGQLDHRELVMRARKAAFARGFIPKNEKPKPTPTRKLELYWAKRNQAHVEAHRQMVAQREADFLEHRRQRIDVRRTELMQSLRQKSTVTRKEGLDRREIFWKKREREDRRKAFVQREADAAREGEVHFLPSLPEAKLHAKATWAREKVREPSSEKEEAINAVSKLSDVWVGSIINMWKEPSHEEKLKEKLKAKAKANKGYAPAAKHFKHIPLPQIGEHAVSQEAPLASPKRSSRAGSRAASRRTPGSKGRSMSDTSDLQASRSRPAVPTVQTSAADVAPMQTVALEMKSARSYTIGGAEVLEVMS